MERRTISIDTLLLSDGNPRLDPSLGEDEAIRNMVLDQNDKLFELASDIVEHGFGYNRGISFGNIQRIL